MAFIPGNKQKTVDFICAKNYPDKTPAEKIRKDVHKELNINYTVHNINLIRHEIRKGKAKPTIITNLIPPDTTPDTTPVITTENTVPQPEDNITKEEQFLNDIATVRIAANKVGGMDRLLYITQMIKKYQYYLN
jgi:hypothetical protein